MISGYSHMNFSQQEKFMVQSINRHTFAVMPEFHILANAQTESPYDIFYKEYVMRIQNVSTYNPNFVGKEQKIIKTANRLAPELKVSAKPAKEPPKTFLEKLGRGLEYVIIKFCRFCFG